MDNSKFSAVKMVATILFVVGVLGFIYFVTDDSIGQSSKYTQIKEAKYNVWIHTSNSTRLELVNEIYKECRKTDYKDQCTESLMDFFMQTSFTISNNGYGTGVSSYNKGET